MIVTKVRIHEDGDPIGTTTSRRLVAGTLDVTVGRRICFERRIPREGVTAATLLAEFHASVLVARAIGDALLPGHGRCIVGNSLGVEDAFTRGISFSVTALVVNVRN